MENGPTPQPITTQSITTSNSTLSLLRRVAVGALDVDSLTEIHILVVKIRKGLHKRARAGRTERTRYVALAANALEEAEGWLVKAQMEE